MLARTAIREMSNVIVQRGTDIDLTTVAALLQERGVVLGRHALEEAVSALRHEVGGAGPLQPLLDDPLVTDVLVNGPGQVWADRAGVLEQVPVDVGTVEDIRALATRLAAAAGSRLDDATPIADARLADGSRLHAVLQPLAEGSPVISVRTHRRRSLTLDDLVASGTVDELQRDVLIGLASVRATVMISGATGSGKTTLLGALLSSLAADLRVVAIEEAREITTSHPHAVFLATRPANAEGAGRVTLVELVQAALRMRPDVVVLGESRGAEMVDVLGALNTGHAALTTLHSRSTADVPARIHALTSLGGLSQHTTDAQILAGVDVVVHIGRHGNHRFVQEIATMSDDGTGRAATRTALKRPTVTAVSSRGPGWEDLARLASTGVVR